MLRKPTHWELLSQPYLPRMSRSRFRCRATRAGIFEPQLIAKGQTWFDDSREYVAVAPRLFADAAE